MLKSTQEPFSWKALFRVLCCGRGSELPSNYTRNLQKAGGRSEGCRPDHGSSEGLGGWAYSNISRETVQLLIC